MYSEPELFRAASAGNLEVVKNLIALGADVNEPNSNGVSPLHTAIHDAYKPGRLEIARELILAGADVNASGCNSSVIHWAISSRHLEAVEMIAKAGAFLDPIDFMGYTPLDCSTRDNHVGMPALLISLGADTGKYAGYDFDKLVSLRLFPLAWEIAKTDKRMTRKFMNVVREWFREDECWILRGLRGLPQEFVAQAMIKTNGKAAKYLSC